MKFPEFTAEVSLYRTNGRYRASASAFGALQPYRSIGLAYIPSEETRLGCYKCLEDFCPRDFAICETAADVTCLINPVVCLGLHAACWEQYTGCLASCNLVDCCPKACRVPNPIHPGVGCCDAGDNCVDESDPNSRYGCCPSAQNVCGGKCCAMGDTCCGDECCPEGWFCLDVLDGKICIQYGTPFVTTPPPPPPPPHLAPFNCEIGSQLCEVAPDRWVCCPPGKECCGPRGCQGTCVA
jgi:hypothetical protein